MQPPNLFVNYSKPDDQQDRKKRREVASYIGTHYRNRSKPLQQREEQKGQDKRSRRASVPVPEEHNSRPFMHQWRLAQTNPSPLDLRDGTGLRDDPFAALPIRRTDRLPRAIDYFFQIYAPTHLNRPYLGLWTSSSHMLKDYFKFAVQNGVMFEAMITISFASMNAATWQNHEPDFDTAYHYGSTVTRLRTELSDEKKLHDDGIFLAVLLLVRAEYILGNVNAYRAHKTALLNMAQLRGGLTQIGWPDISRPGLTSIMSQCRFFASSASETLRSIGGSIEDYAPVCQDTSLLTPLHIPPELENQPLSNGLQRLCDDGRLSPSVAFLAAMSLNNPYIDVRSTNSAANGVFSVDLIEHVEWSIANNGHNIEDEICLMILHGELYGLSSSERYSPLHLDIVRHWARRCLELMLQISPEDSPLVDMFIWACFKIAGTMIADFLKMKSTDAADFRLKLLAELKASYVQMQSWESTQAILMQFNPRPECLMHGEQIWQMLNATDHSNRMQV